MIIDISFKMENVKNCQPFCASFHVSTVINTISNPLIFQLMTSEFVSHPPIYNESKMKFGQIERDVRAR
jgi:hypothetical protein